MVKAHQLLHGYSNGHRRLSGSLRLSSRDDELISRISDLSGPLLGGQEFQPYFTGYPLPSDEYYAIARTWIDSQAPRAGSVLTHTLLISMTEFGEVEDIEVFFCLLEQKPRRSELWYYEEPLGVPFRSSSKSENVCLNETTVVDFVEKYFGEGVRPILWLDVTSPEKVVRLLFRHLWPQMRCHFAFCTLSLQLRSLDDRPFDILFAPSSRRGKHHQVEQRNLVGAQPSKETQIQRWEADFARAVFLGRPKELQFREEFAEIRKHFRMPRW